MNRRIYLASICLLILVSAGFYSWILGQNQRSPYYVPFTESYTRNLAAGHSDMGVKPDARLLALRNPYDPKLNGNVGALFDASYFKGRYYVYFGITPFATLLVPWYLITHHVIAADAGVGLYCLLGLLASVATLFIFQRRYPGNNSHVAVLLGALVMGLGSPALLLLRRPEIYELEIAAGWFHVALTLLFATLATQSTRHRLTWISAASLSLGLAVGCRPNCVVLAPIFLFWAMAAFRKGDAPRPASAPLVMAALIPMGAIGAALAWFNWIRFGNPLEFGFHYQLVSYDRMNVGFWSITNVPYNLYHYLLGGARISPYFPFFMGESDGPIALPVGHEATDQVYGCLIFLPFLWILIGLGFAAVRRSADLMRTALLPLLFSAGILAVFLVMGNGAYRYMADFVPPALFAAALVLLDLSNRLGDSRAVRVGFWSVSASLALLNCASSIFQESALYERFQMSAPQAYSKWSYWVNQPVYWIERATGLKAKVPFMDVTFPTGRTGTDEPLFVCGNPAAQDFLYVYYSSPDAVRIGFESIGHGGPLSASIPLDYSKAHRLVLTFGSFIPPDGHPLLRDLSEAEIADLRANLFVTLDGRPVLDSGAFFHEPKNRLYWGESPFDEAFGRRFSGTIVKKGFTLVHVDSPPDRNLGTSYGTYSIKATEPAQAVGTKMPLLSAGYHPTGSVVFIERSDATHAKLGILSNTGALLGAPVEMDFWQMHVYEITYGALYPSLESPAWPDAYSPDRRAALKRHALLKIDGKVSLDASIEVADASPVSVAIGVNAVSLSGIGPTLPGKCSSSGPAGINPILPQDEHP